MKNIGPIDYGKVMDDFAARNYTLVSSKIKTRVEKLKYVCNRHEGAGVQEISLSGFYRGRGCYHCGRERTVAARKLTDQKLGKRCKALNFTYVGRYQYKGNLYVRYVCNKHKQHGIQFKLAGNLNKAVNCPYCKASHGEAKISEYLTKHNYHFIREERFSDCRDKYTLPV